jgi:hypothetical protein
MFTTLSCILKTHLFQDHPTPARLTNILPSTSFCYKIKSHVGSVAWAYRCGGRGRLSPVVQGQPRLPRAPYQAWCYTSVIPALGRQENQFKASLSCIENPSHNKQKLIKPVCQWLNACTPGYLVGRDREDHGLRPTRQIVQETHISKITRAKWTGGMTQAVVFALQAQSLESKKYKNKNPF